MVTNIPYETYASLFILTFNSNQSIKVYKKGKLTFNSKCFTIFLFFWEKSGDKFKSLKQWRGAFIEKTSKFYFYSIFYVPILFEGLFSFEKEKCPLLNSEVSILRERSIIKYFSFFYFSLKSS